MDTTTFLLALMTVCLVGVAIHAWRIGNERRDVALLGTIAALCSAGTVAVAVS
jgi:cbb3-type cytochrome oxidase subunit 3